MKKLLTLLGILTITGAPVVSVISCNPENIIPKSILETFQINPDQTGAEILKHLHTFMITRYYFSNPQNVTKIASYHILYNDIDISINSTTKVILDMIVTIVILLTNKDGTMASDQQNLVNEGFALGVKYTEKIKVTEINKQDIKTVTIVDLKTPATEEQTYQDLNNNGNIITVIQEAINRKLNITASNLDFVIINNQELSQFQKPDTVVTFTIRAKKDSTLIQGCFSFINTLSVKQDISAIVIPELTFKTEPTKTYEELNSNQIIIAGIISIINSKLAMPISKTDFNITNDQSPTAFQIPAVEVEFTITANISSSLLKGNLKFKQKLAKVDISDIEIGDLATKADPTLTYADLNINSEILAGVIAAIKPLLISKKDLVLINDQVPTKSQKGETVVKFTVTATKDSILISKSFTFYNTLQ